MSPKEFFSKSRESAVEGPYFPMELCKRLQREINFVEGVRNSVVVGLEILQEAK